MTEPASTDEGAPEVIAGVGLGRRLAAIGALALAALVVVAAIAAAEGNLGRLLSLPVLLLVAVVGAWVFATRRGIARLVGAAVVVTSVVVTVVAVLTAESRGVWLAVIAVTLVASGALSRFALGRDVHLLTVEPLSGNPVEAAERGVLIMNLRSGGGKAEQFGLEAECERRGIEPVVLREGDDLLELARAAVERGADVIGMAGGDGSQALVASVAAEAGIAMVCIPAGTRNHFALDLGLDRDDVVGALDAYAAAKERRVDLATVNGRTFVNNVSLGVYAKIVQSPEYRDAKGQTAVSMLPDLLGPEGEPFDLHFETPEGEVHSGAQLIQVSNNAYTLAAGPGFGTRASLEDGVLGIAAVHLRHAGDAGAFVAAQAAGQLHRFGGWYEWEAPTFEVTSSSGVEAGVDGEALVLDPPLQFAVQPGVLRIRLPVHAPGYSQAAGRGPSLRWTVVALARAATGRTTPLAHLDDPLAAPG